MRTNYFALMLATLGLVAASNVQAGFFPESVSKICSTVPRMEDGIPSKATEYLPYIKCLNAKADFLDNVLKETLETAIATVKDPEAKEMLQHYYNKYFGNPKQKGKTSKLTSKTSLKILAGQAGAAEDRMVSTTLDTIKILSIMYPSKYPTSRFRTELEKEDLEQTYEGIEGKVSNKAALEADQQAWEKKRDEFCSSVYDSTYRGAAYFQEEECKNIMSRIRIKELEAMIGKH